MAYETVQVSSTEEYFVEDRDQVYCKHGSYIGYPGGPDFICGACEDGLDTLHQGIKAILQYRLWYPEEGLWGLWNEIETSYSFNGCREWTTWYTLFAKSTFDYEIEIKWESFSFWGSDDETPE